MLEQPRPDAPNDEHAFLLSVEEAADRYAAASHPRTIRAIQKYCARGDLECQKVETTYGERYLITPASVDRHIAMIIERTAASGHEQPRADAPVRTRELQSSPAIEVPASVREEPRPAAVDDRYVKLLERENEFLRGQMITKDGQIKELAERSRETNILIGGLQKMLSPLLRIADKKRPDEMFVENDLTSSTQQ
jgi:hypothetical protein